MLSFQTDIDRWISILPHTNVRSFSNPQCQFLWIFVQFFTIRLDKKSQKLTWNQKKKAVFDLTTKRKWIPFVHVSLSCNIYNCEVETTHSCIIKYIIDPEEVFAEFERVYSKKTLKWPHFSKRAFTYDVRCFSSIFDLPTYPHQILYCISLFSKIWWGLTYLPTQKSDVIYECSHKVHNNVQQ